MCYNKQYIVKLKPVYKEYLWGGNKLNKLYNKNFPVAKVAESWEFAIHKDGENIVDSGVYKGMLLSEYISMLESIDGVNRTGRSGRLPIMIKLIDAADNLSIQVHPTDNYAQKNEFDFGKNEMWYIAECEENASVFLGFSKDTNREEVAVAIENNTLPTLLNKISVKKGDSYYIPAGTIHAINKGVIICEVQQNSNITYRVYDYNRVDADGNFRELNIERALDVIDYKQYSEINAKKNLRDLFSTVQTINNSSISLALDTAYVALILEGECDIICEKCDLHLRKGETCFIPRKHENVYITSEAAKVIITRIH